MCSSQRGKRTECQEEITPGQALTYVCSRGEAFPPTNSSQGLLMPGLCGGFWTGFPGPNKVIQSTCALDLAVWCGNPEKSCVLLRHGFIPISALLNCTIP